MNLVAAQASRDRKAAAALELVNKVVQLEAALRAAQSGSPSSPSTSNQADGPSPRVTLLEQENQALHLELRMERAASIALRQRLEGLEKQFAQLETLLAKPASAPSWLQQLPPLPTPASLAPSTPAPAPFSFAPISPQPQAPSPVGSMSMSSSVVPTVVEENQTVTSCSNATGASLPREVTRPSHSTPTINSTSTSSPPPRPSLHQVLAAIRLPPTLLASLTPTESTTTPSPRSGTTGPSRFPSLPLRLRTSSSRPSARRSRLVVKDSTISLLTCKRARSRRLNRSPLSRRR